jgi:hypothetical protein
MRTYTLVGDIYCIYFHVSLALTRNSASFLRICFRKSDKSTYRLDAKIIVITHFVDQINVFFISHVSSTFGVSLNV